MAAAVPALEVAPNGATIRATQPREFYENNQRHTMDGKEYTVVLTTDELKEAPDKSLCVTSFITDMQYLFNGKIDFNENISSWDTSNVVNMDKMFYRASSFN
jgi:surface protein